LKNNLLPLLVLLTTLSSCEFFRMKNKQPLPENVKKPIARAYDAYLYAEDLEGIASSGMQKEDSIDRVTRYINNWAKKQILIKNAAENIDFDEADIERKILDYRYSLMAYEYQSFYINTHLDKAVTLEQVEEYYNNNIDNFILKDNIVRGLFVSIPVEAPKTENIPELLKLQSEEDGEKLTSYCLSYATNYQLNDSIWMNLHEIIKGTPWSESEDKETLISANEYLFAADSLNAYHIKIIDYRKKGEVSPLSFVSKQIEDIIINKRKIELARKLEQDVYTKAQKNNEIEIYE